MGTPVGKVAAAGGVPARAARRLGRGPLLGLLAAIVALHVAIRYAWLDRAFDHVVFPMYELYVSGTVGRILELGLEQPLGIHYDNSAGYFINGALAAPLFALFGPSYLTFKLVPLLYGVGVILLLFGWVRGLLGDVAALVAAALFAMGPTELLQKYSVIGTGNHFENLFYLTAALWAFDAAMRRAGAPGAWRWWLLAGFTAGFNVFVFLGAVIPVGCMAGTHLVARGLRPWLRDLRSAAPGFLLGFSPLVLINLAVATRGSDFLLTKFSSAPSRGEASGFLERLLAFLGPDLVRAPFPGLEVSHWGQLLRALWYLVLLTLGLPVMVRIVRLIASRGLLGRTDADGQAAYAGIRWFPLIAWTPLAAVAFALSDLQNGLHRDPVAVGGYRYFLPHFHLLGVLVVALALSLPRLRGLAGVALLGLGLLGLVPLGRALEAGEDRGIGARYEGYNFEQYARGLFMETSGVPFEERLRIAADLPRLERQRLHRTLGFYAAQKQVVMRADADGDGRVTADERKGVDPLVSYASPLDLESLLAGVPPAFQLDWARGAGSGLRTLVGNGERARGALVAGLAALVEDGHPLAPAVVEGSCWLQDYPTLARDVPRHLALHEDLARRLLDAGLVDEEGLSLGGRSLGRFAGRVLGRGHPPDAPRFAELFLRAAPLHRRALYEGLGIGLADGRSVVSWPEAAMDAIVPVELQPIVAEALAAECVRVDAQPGAPRWVNETTRLDQALAVVPTRLREAVLRGGER